MERNLLISLLLQILTLSCYGQALNNQIENRIRLKVDAGWITSSTSNSTVEWNCINKALTNKCLVYHNDQWFTIKPGGTGPFFLNVSSQQCKKLFGVQLVIIEGDPCQTNSYRLKKCIPFTDQSDFFVKLDSLDPSQEYLINIDGYLGDLCSFKIALSSSFQGIRVDAQKLSINAAVTQQDSVVLLGWVIHDSLAFQIKEFLIYRKNEKEKSAAKLSIPMLHNAYGLAQTKYQTFDTLGLKGKYTYSIYGRTTDDILLLAREQISYPDKGKSPVTRSARNYKRQIEYFVRSAGPVSVHVLDAFSGKRIFSTNRRSEKGKNTVMLDFSPLVEQGVFNYKIIIESKDQRQEYPIKIDPKSDQ